MFKNVGSKLESVATMVFVLGTIISVVIALIMMFARKNPNGIFVLLCGPFCSWFNAVIIYGFGRIVDNTEKIRTILEKGGSSATIGASGQFEHIFYCPSCKGTYRASRGETVICSKCSLPAKETEVTADTWNSCASEVKARFIDEFDRGAHMTQLSYYA